MDQGTESWQEWRRKGLGASDAPIIMGVSPWKTPYQLWMEKVGLSEPFKGNWATDRGNQLEPKARALYELEHDEDMPPCLVEHPEFPHIRASLDGRNELIRRTLEIKCPGQEDHAKAVAGEVPEKYWPQCQHQLACTGDEELHYWSYDGNGSTALVKVRPDKEYQAKLIKKLNEFWHCVQTKTPPKLTDRDFKELKSAKDIALFEELKKAKLVLDLAKYNYELVEKQVKEKASKHPRIQCAGVMVTQSIRAGAVDYKKVPQLEGVDLEPYRKSPVVTTSVKFPKETEEKSA